MDIPKLMAELAAGHPVTGTYDADAEVAAGQLNAANCTRNVKSVSGQQVFEAVTGDDYSALSVDELQQFWGIIGMGEILVNAANTKAALLAMFGPGSDTRTNLAALQAEEVSRAVELELGFIYPGHVQNARM